MFKIISFDNLSSVWMDGKLRNMRWNLETILLNCYFKVTNVRKLNILQAENKEDENLWSFWWQKSQFLKVIQQKPGRRTKNIEFWKWQKKYSLLSEYMSIIL